MATGKQGFVRAAEPQHSVSMQRGKEMRVQAPLTAMYLQPMPGLPTCSPAQPAAMQDAAVIPLPLPVMCSNQALPILTLHIAGGAAVQQQRPDTPVTSPRPKSAGKHVCPHCGRDCLKPSVLEKHLRCHTGERPYPCTTCGISFKTQSNLYKHKRTQAHARLSSESGKGAFSSQESTESSRETCSSPSLELQSEESGDVNKSESVVPAVTVTTFSSTQVTLAEGKPTSDTEWALRKAAVVGLVASPVHGQQEILNSAGQRIQLAPNGKNEATSIHTKSPAGDGRAPLTPNRTPLQRQEALFPKLSRGKSQSYDSTDSGFSESSEQHLTSSPGDTLHESMESLPEASMELQEPESSNKPSDVTTDDAKSKVSVQEKQKLEEHILKLISENSVLVDDKHLVNVRPRKTVLSKQGSIDLPMPYTYKDSFHFEMRSSKHQVSSLQTPDRKGRVVYSSVPTQHSTNLEHAPLTRSSSLPFSVGIQNNDRTAFSYQGDSIPLSRRCSAGNICPFKSVDQHAPHRSLVRQVAVDCLSIAEGLSTERSSHSSLSSDGDCGDTSTESGVKRCRRKKAQKFAYNKWYMYGGGTFKKLYSTEKDSLLKSRKTAPSLEQTESQGIQISQQRDNNSSGSLSFISCSAASLPPAVNVFTAQTSSQVVPSYVLLQSPLMEQTTGQMQHGSTKKTDDQKPDLNTETTLTSGTEEKNKGTETQFSRGPIPSERKKPKTEDDLCARMENTDLLQRQKCVLTSRKIEENTNLRDVISQSLQSVCGDVFQASNISALDTDNRLNIHRKASFSNPSTSNHSQLLFKRHSSPLFGTNVSGASGSPSASSSISVSQAKTSFLPKYQLKIPCSTDGVSDPCVSNHSSLDQSSLSQTLMLSNQSAQQCDPGPSTSSTTQNHLATTMMSYGQEQQASNQEEPLSIVQPSQPKSCWLSCTSAATERHISTESVLTNMVCQYKPLNQRGVSKMDTSKLMHEAQGNQAYTPSQASVHLSQQHCSTLGTKITLSNREEVTALAASTDHVTSAYFESDKPVSESIQEKSINCGEASCGLDPVNQDLFTGPRVGGSLQSSQLQREARTGSQGWVPQEPESGGGDGVRVGNKCMEQEDCAKEDEREGATETHDGYQTATEPHSHVSQPVTNACHNTSSSAELDTSSVSGSATTALCGATSLSHDSTHVGQRAGTHPDNSEQVKQSDCAETPKLIDQSEVNVMERVPLECQERFTLLSSVPSVSGAARHLQSTCGHLLAHPLLVNAIQKEVQKETQAKNSATLLSHANASQMQGPLSENKSDKPFMTSTPCNADSNQTINTTLTQNNLPCPKRTNSNAMHSYQPCASTAHHTPIEPNAPQCHSGGSYLEGEESSSSSDDEGKLVIELE
ncbi:zinc finger protein 831 isoform X2 [Salminus brasiliensis]|uniref:zinc finger protein 831 isoform X2 n=1 Tax=Salminus brasiliensis TaxID=930266 RepID=UPI003B835719